MKISKVHDLVKEILESNSSARNSDNTLYTAVIQKLEPSLVDEPFWFVMANISELKLPPYETVRRTRQKIQAECPWLQATDKVVQERRGQIIEFREYAVSHGYM